MLKSTNPELTELREVVGDILHHDQRAAEVIKRMRSLLKKAPFELKILDLNDLARETIEFLSALARGRNVELHSTIAPGELPILGDPIQLQQVILNLVVNGIDAMGETPTKIACSRFGRRVSNGLPNCPFLIVGRVSRQTNSKRSLNRFSPPRPKVWAWACRSRAPLSRHTMG